MQVWQRQENFLRREGEVGGAVLNEEPIGGNWGLEAWWLFIGCAVLVSHWLSCCQGGRESSFPCWVVSSNVLHVGDSR